MNVVSQYFEDKILMDDDDLQKFSPLQNPVLQRFSISMLFKNIV